MEQEQTIDMSNLTTSFYCKHCDKFLSLDNFNNWSITHNNHTCKNCRKTLPAYINRKRATTNELGIKCSCGCGELVTEFGGVANKYIQYHKNKFGLRSGKTRTIDDVLEAMKEKFVITDDNHWLWSGSKTMAGYGVITFRQKQVLVRRLIHALIMNSGIFSTSPLKNICKNRFCCNPEHLESKSSEE